AEGSDADAERDLRGNELRAHRIDVVRRAVGSALVRQLVVVLHPGPTEESERSHRQRAEPSDDVRADAQSLGRDARRLRDARVAYLRSVARLRLRGLLLAERLGDDSEFLACADAIRPLDGREPLRLETERVRPRIEGDWRAVELLL